MFKKTAALMMLSASLFLGACSQKEEAKPAQPAGAAASEITLDRSKTYIVATDASYAPMEYMENGQVVGFSRDILDAAAKSQNVKLEFVNTPFEGLFANVDKGDSDIGLASITRTPEREQQLDFSARYFTATQMIVLPERVSNVKSFADLKERTAAVQAATSGDLILQELQGKDSQNIKRFENMPLAFKEMENGGADVVVGDSSVVGYYAQQHPESKLTTLVDPTFVQEQYGFVFKKGRSDGLRELINEGLAQIESDGDKASGKLSTYDTIHKKWFGVSASGN